MGEVQAQVTKQTVAASDPQAMGQESERPPAASRRLVSARDRRVSRLSSSFFCSFLFMDGSSLGKPGRRSTAAPPQERMTR